MPAPDVQAFNTANWSLDNSFLVQLQDPGEPYEAACPFYVIDHPEGTVVVDTGLSHEMLDDPAGYGPTGAAFMEEFLPYIEYDESMHPRAQLAEAGYAPEDIDYLLLTHLHSDHAGHVDLFPDAEVLVRTEELRHAFWPVPIQDLFYLDGDFMPLRSPEFDVTEVAGEYDVFGDGSVIAFPTPGHTPGHQSVHVDLGDEEVILAADVAHRKVGYENGFQASFNWDLSQSVESLREVKSRARRTGADVRLLHDRGDTNALR
ncbi:N-acyl homoserine lactonase family protein [Halosegnis sp.]|uniref:N-acyl homoserine lactonase family protein n=1 Tax=Halosegnis sp. TaxID=2864959 RepID=UPI0035D429C0